MSEDYRGFEKEPGPSKWLRKRWKYGSVLVLDIDHVICTCDAERGLLIEWKHSSAVDKTWRIARALGKRLRWWAALFVYDTADGQPDGEVIAIRAEFQNPDGKRYSEFRLDEQAFARWVCREFGAEPFEDAA